MKQILSFIRLLKAGEFRKKIELAAASESSLGKDWLRPEEDEAWRDL